MRRQRPSAAFGWSPLLVDACLAATFALPAARGIDLPPHLEDPPRMALVIGIEDYPNLPGQSRTVANALSDASKIAETLGSNTLGFDVDTAPSNPGINDLRNRIIDFSKRIKTVETPAIVAVYFAGHGLRHTNGHDYLVAADASADDLRKKSISVYWLADLLSEGPVAAAIVLIDACRVNPLTEDEGKPATGSLGPAFGHGNLPGDEGFRVFYGFASKPNEYAVSFVSPGAENSPFVEALVSHLPQEGVDVERVFKKVSEDVSRAIKDQHPTPVPFLYDELYLNPTEQCLKQHKAFFALAKEYGRACVLAFREEYPLGPQLGGVHRYLVKEKPEPQTPCKEKEDFDNAVEGCDR